MASLKQILVAAYVKNELPSLGKAKVAQRERRSPRAVQLAFFSWQVDQKNDPGTDFSAASVAQALIIAEDLQAATLEQIEEAIQDGYIEELKDVR